MLLLILSICYLLIIIIILLLLLLFTLCDTGLHVQAFHWMYASKKKKETISMRHEKIKMKGKNKL